MWHRSLYSSPQSTGDHTLDLFYVDLRCAAGARESRPTQRYRLHVRSVPDGWNREVTVSGVGLPSG